MALPKRSDVVGSRDAGETRVSNQPKVQIRSTDHSVTIEPVEDDEGQTVKAVWGAEYFQIVQYNGFTVGPFEATTTVRDGETVVDALLRLHADLAAAAVPIRTAKANTHVEELRRLGIGVR
jgi:hypothetical protein